MTTHPAPEPTGPRSRRVPGWVRWAIVVVAVVAIGWAIVALAPRQPRPRLVSDPEAAPAASCGAFGAEPSDPAAGTVGYVPCTLPEGFVLIEPPIDVASSAEAADGGPATQPYVVYYSRMIGDGAPDSIAVITVASDVPETGGDTTVRGHPARLVEQTSDGGPLQVRWTEEPGINVQISAWGRVSIEELLTVAEDIVPRSPFDSATTTTTSTTAATAPPSTDPGGTTPTGAPTPPTSSAPTASSGPTSTTSSTTGTGPTTSTGGGVATTLPISTTVPITVPPVVSSLVPTLPSTVTTPDEDEGEGDLGDLPVIGDLPIIGDVPLPGDDGDDGDGDGDGSVIDDLPIIGDLPLPGDDDGDDGQGDADRAGTPAPGAVDPTPAATAPSEG